MQTFLPLPDFHLSAHALDMRRLGKQRVECLQLLNVNLSLRFPWMISKKGWINHPAARMWRGHESWLLAYAMIVCQEWIRRGYKDALLPRFEIMADQHQVSDPMPSWFGQNEFHASHRSNLLRKDPVWYNQFGWKEPNDLPYVWPS